MNVNPLQVGFKLHVFNHVSCVTYEGTVRKLSEVLNIC